KFRGSSAKHHPYKKQRRANSRDVNTSRGACLDLFTKFFVISLSCLYLAPNFVSNFPKLLIEFPLNCGDFAAYCGDILFQSFNARVGRRIWTRIMCYGRSRFIHCCSEIPAANCEHNMATPQWEPLKPRLDLCCQ